MIAQLSKPQTSQPIELRYYQQEAVDSVYNHLRHRDDNPLIVIPTAGGKTPVMATICRDAVSQWHGRVLILAHVKELLQQTADTLKKVAPDLDVGVYSAGLKARDTHQSVIVAGIQSIYSIAHQFEPFDLVMVDECFPKGTLVSTPRGDLAIEDLYVGQPVHTALGVGEIEAISARNTDELIELEFEDGKTIQCTPNHPFFTEHGWKEAKTLEIGENLFSRKDMRVLRSCFSALDQAGPRMQYNELHEGKSLEKAAFLLDILLEESGERYVDSGRSPAGQSDSKGYWAQSKSSRWKRPVNPISNTIVKQAGRRLVSGICGGNRQAPAKGDGQKYQDRYCQSENEDRDRTGWEFPYHTEKPQCRQKADGLFASQRVVRVTYIQCKSPVAVFNLQVKGHPSYYADGVLAHNCHLIPMSGEGMYRTFLSDAKDINPLIRVIGLTATPYRLKGGVICKPTHFLNSICHEVGVRELIDEGYLCPLRSKAGKSKAELSGLHIRAGEFIASEVEAAMDDYALVKAACQEIAEKTKDRNSVLIFASGVSHGRHVAQTIESITDSRCGFICGDTPGLERESLLHDFKNGNLKFLANVNVLTTGFDAPNVDSVVLLRPTNSPGLYYQMVGRGFRLHPDKTDCLVLDYGGNILRHGPVDTLNIKEPGAPTGKTAPQKECPECQEMVHASCNVCPDCGYEFPVDEKPRHSGRAADDDILARDITDTSYAVQAVDYYVHHKLNAPPDAPVTMRVEYQVGLGHYIREWVCFEHSGYARGKAVAWWNKRSREPMPKTTAQAVDIAERGCVAEPDRIVVREKADTKFPEIIRCDLGAIPPRIDGSDERELAPDEGAMPDWYDDDEIPF